MVLRQLLRLPLLALLLAASAACAPMPTSDNAGSALVRAFVEAYNAHDFDRMSALLADDVVWLSVDGDAVAVELRGIKALRAWQQEYWRGLPDSRSRLLSVGPGGRHVQAYECALWTGKDGRGREQCSTSVYEVAGGRIQRVWYFPSEPPPAQ